MWRALDSGYGYFERGRDSWKRSRSFWRLRAERAATREEFVAALEAAVATLHDEGVTLSESTQRRVPYETDIHARRDQGRTIVAAVRAFSDADVAGLRPGQEITRVDGVTVEKAIVQRLGKSPATPRAVDWALDRLFGGPQSGLQRVEVRDGQRVVTFNIERRAPANGNASPPILGRRMGDERDIGYLRLRIGASDGQFVEHFEGALHHLLDTRALIVDLRENAAPGSPEITKAILARFAAAAYRAPVAVLVDRWTAGEGEALAAALRSTANARLIGTATAGMRGDLREIRLPNSGIVVSFPAGGARGMLQPDVAVDLAAPSGGPGDPILYQALKAFERR